MAKSSAYRWQNERKRGLLGKPPTPKKRKRGKAGITPKQAKYLASLQRQLRVKYTGNGMTRAEASSAIDDAKRQLEDARRLDSGLDAALERDEAA